MSSGKINPVASDVSPAIGESGLQAGGAHPVTIEVRVRLQAIAIPEAAGGYSIIVPALPGCFSAAESIEDVQANVVEAAEGWLDAQHDRGKEEALRVARG